MSNPRNVASLASVTVAALLLAGCTAAPVEPQTSERSPGISADSVTLGISGPLTGPSADAGACAVAGLVTYVEAKNADGGFEFGDGVTRSVVISSLDDAGEPQRAASNFRDLVDAGIFAYVGGLGSATNAAMVPIARDEQVPQVLLLTSGHAFSADQDALPGTLGLLPSYYDEGFAFGQALARRGSETTVALLAQDDDYGNDYVAGFEAAIDGSDVSVIAASRYQPFATSLDAQVGELAASDADVLVSAVSLASLQVAVLTRAQSLGWTPEVFLPANTASPDSIVIPGGGAAYPAVYSTTFAKSPADPEHADDADVVAYLDAFERFGAEIAATQTPHCVWSYIGGAVLEEVFLGMAAPTREAFLESLHSLADVDAPLLLDGITIDTTDATGPAIDGVKLTRFTGTGFEVIG